MQVLDSIPFQLDEEAFFSKVRVKPESDYATEVRSFIGAAAPLARPKVMCRIGFVEARGDDAVTISGTTFTSRVLRVNLAEVERVFVYVATCGRELDDAGLAQGDMLKEFWLDNLKAMALSAATDHFKQHLRREYALDHASAMHPGSGEADIWPLEQQRPLFDFLGDVEKAIGVRLTDSFLMMPNKTVSGLYFPTEVTFETCQLCTREVCPSRRSPYDRALAEKRYSR
jgi:hypothetical protein